MAPAEDQKEDTSLARGRSRRAKVDKSGRFAALEKFKKAKQTGERIKYEEAGQEEDCVYDVVDEEEYSKIVRKRQDDDWIVDDDGAGYVEDGREIFDDDIEAPPTTNTKGPGRKDRKKGEKKNPNILNPNAKPKDIKTMFAAAAVKKKVEKSVTLNNDDVLDDIMAELNQKPTTGSIKPGPVNMSKKSTTPTSGFMSLKKPYNNPFSSKRTPTRTPDTKPLQPRNMSSNMSSPTLPKARKVIQKPAIKKEIVDEDVEEPEADLDMGSENEIAEDMGDISAVDFDDNFEEDCKKEVKTEIKAEIKKEVPKIEEDIPSGWQSIKCDPEEAVSTNIQIDSSNLPLIANENGEQVLRMFWLDAYEDVYNRDKPQGTVYLFGKVWLESAKAHISCCVEVLNIERCMFVLPREKKFDMKANRETEDPVTFMDVYQEIKQKCDAKKITNTRTKKSSKKYVFEKEDVPVETDYLELRYNAKFPSLKETTGESFSHIFGCNRSCLEGFILERKLKGPAWIDIKFAQRQPKPKSWCKLEALVTDPNHVTVMKDGPAPPPLTTLTLSMKTLPNQKTHQNEIVGVAGLVHNKFQVDRPAPKQLYQSHFSAVNKVHDTIFPYDFEAKAKHEGADMKLEVMQNERAMLGWLMAKIQTIDPDVVIGHDIYGFDLDVLMHRITTNKIPNWSRLGRLKRANMPKLSGVGSKNTYSEKNACCGRILCDVKISAKELVRCKSYDLTHLSSQLLKLNRVELDADQIRAMFGNTKDLMKLIGFTLTDSLNILKIMYELNVIPLALQITNICGNTMARTLMGGRSERNEYLLLHAFHEKNYIVPDKSYGKKPAPHVAADEDGEMDTTVTKKQGRKKPAYAGGLVLEPKKGFYDKFILLLDFNSLYPSIIQEYNICFTTISMKDSQQKKEGDEDDWNLDLPDSDLEPGVLPTEIRKLVESRRHVKQLMKAADVTPEMYMQYDIRQKALKLTANSMYGCLGFSFSRFYARPLAALVTGKGREILLQTKDLVQKMNLDVIYGDTDSIMVNTNSEDLDLVYKLGNKVKSEVNKLYRLLEIDIDGVFKSMLLLKKKKYAALTVSKGPDGQHTFSQELKGLDIIRRDWCDLAKEAGNFVVNQILSGESRETIVENIHEKLTEVGEKVKSGEISTEMYYITKQLTKNPEDYPDKKSLAHVQVALRLNSKSGGKKMRAGDTVYYIICDDGSDQASSQRAYHPDELGKNENLKIDTKYYLSNQVHPVISRLCDPIEGTDAAHLAECLGLDPSGYRHTTHNQLYDEDDAMLGAQLSEEERYKDCDRFKFTCPECKKEIIFDSVFTGAGSAIRCQLEKCPGTNCTYKPYEHVGAIMNKLTLRLREHIKKYYQGWMKCDDSTCAARTRKLPLNYFRGHVTCQVCHRGNLIAEYSDTGLYTQMCFYQFIFDLPRALDLLVDEDRVFARKIEKFEEQHLALKSLVGRKLKQNAYSEVNLTRLFEGLFPLVRK